MFTINKICDNVGVFRERNGNIFYNFGRGTVSEIVQKGRYSALKVYINLGLRANIGRSVGIIMYV